MYVVWEEEKFRESSNNENLRMWKKFVKSHIHVVCQKKIILSERKNLGAENTFFNYRQLQFKENKMSDALPPATMTELLLLVRGGNAPLTNITHAQSFLVLVKSTKSNVKFGFCTFWESQISFFFVIFIILCWIQYGRQNISSFYDFVNNRY